MLHLHLHQRKTALHSGKRLLLQLAQYFQELYYSAVITACLSFLGVDKGGYSDMTPQERQLLEILDNMFKGFEAILDTSQSEIDVTAFNYAIQETLNLLANTQDLGSRNHSNDAFNDAINESNNYNGFVTKAASKNKNFEQQQSAYQTLQSLS